MFFLINEEFVVFVFFDVVLERDDVISVKFFIFDKVVLFFGYNIVLVVILV